MRDWTPAELAIMDRIVATAPPFSSAQLSQVSAIMGIMPVNVPVA